MLIASFIKGNGRIINTLVRENTNGLNGLKHGNGKYVDKDGNVFEGNWRLGKR